VVLTPGFRSLVALSTHLAEELASHGYVVVAAQTDVVTEAGHRSPTTRDRDKRFAQVSALLDALNDPAVTALVGPLDVRRVALGGHSYAATIAFNTGLQSRRVAAVFDLDGGITLAASTTPLALPSLVVVTPGGSERYQPLVKLMSHSPHAVAVGLVDASHFDVTDAPCITSGLGTSVVPRLLGTIGCQGTIDTSAIVLRFLDAVFGSTPRLPTSAELIAGLPSATADPFGTGR
jgi:pimeloyl-ACP methyl ester carboxylesterase